MSFGILPFSDDKETHNRIELACCSITIDTKTRMMNSMTYANAISRYRVENLEAEKGHVKAIFVTSKVWFNPTHLLQQQ